MKKPNVIVILTDDQGYGDLGCMGSTDLKTPKAGSVVLWAFLYPVFSSGSSVNKGVPPARIGYFTSS